MTTDTLLGKGLYSIPEAARIVHTFPRSVRRWTLGYKLQGSERSSPPILPAPVLKLDGEEILTFQQLVEVLFISLFRKHNISMPVIRAAAYRAAMLFKTDHPFAVEGLRTDGKAIFLLSPDDVEGVTRSQAVQDLARGQFVIKEFAEPYFTKIHYEHLEAVRYWPLGKDRNVVIDPNRAFGEPIDAKTGVPTKAVYGMYRGGGTVEAISHWYGVEQEAIRDIIEFEQSLMYKAA